MKTITIILATGLTLFSTVYSSAWCVCGTRPSVAEHTCCTGIQHATGTDNGHHCPRYENRTEAVTAGTGISTGFNTGISVITTISTDISHVTGNLPAAALTAIRRKPPGPDRHTVLII